MNILSRSKWTRALLFLTILAVVSSCALRNHADTTPAGQAWSQKDLEQIIENWRSQTNIPGVVVGISQPGREELIIASGVSSLKEGTPISKTAQFRIASIAKTFIAAEVLKLSAAGHVKLVAPISDYLSDVKYGQEITVRQLLSHRPGLAD